MTTDNIHTIARRAINNWVNKNVNISERVTFNHTDTIENIRAYMSSKHMSGPTDANGHEKPFYNIVVPARNTWMKATKIDRKDIRIRANKPADYAKSFIFGILLREWMRKEQFGEWLKDWGETLATYGSAVSKFVKKGNDLHASIIPWDHLIVDPIDMMNNIIIEKIYLTADQLQDSGYDPEAIIDVIEAVNETRKDTRNQQKDNYADYIGLYEIHGKLPRSLITGLESDKDIYQQQMHVIFVASGKESNDYDSDESDCVLYKGFEKSSPYRKTDLLKIVGRSLGMGAVELLFEAQWVVNDNAYMMREQGQLSSKTIYQSADTDLASTNTMTDMDNGDIIITKENMPISVVDTTARDINQLQSVLNDWKDHARELSATPENMTGETMPSGTPYRLVEILNNESHSLFDIMVERKGLALEEILREIIIPYFKDSLKTVQDVAMALDGNDLAELDSLAMPMKLTEQLKHQLLTGNMPSIQDATTEVQKLMTSNGNNRFLSVGEAKDFAAYFKDFDHTVEIEITGEENDKNSALTTLSSILQTVAQNPNVLNDPTLRLLFMRIVEETGVVSPAEIMSSFAQGQQQQAQAQQAQQQQPIQGAVTPPSPSRQVTKGSIRA